MSCVEPLTEEETATPAVGEVGCQYCRRVRWEERLVRTCERVCADETLVWSANGGKKSRVRGG